MLRIAGGIILAIVIILIVANVRNLIVYIVKEKKSEKREEERVRLNEEKERKETEEFLDALESGDEYAKQGKEAYFKHKATVDFMKSLSEPPLSERLKKSK